MAIGICNVSENASGVGITAVPHPITDMSWDGWLYHALLGPLISLTTTEEGQTGLAMIRHEIDSKAMRKLKAQDVTVGVVEVSTEIGTATMTFQARTRILDKLA